MNKIWTKYNYRTWIIKLAVYERYIIIYIYITDYPEYIAHHMRCSKKHSEQSEDAAYASNECKYVRWWSETHWYILI